MIDIQVDTSRLQVAISEFADLSKKDAADIMRVQGGILVGHVIALTPPGGGKGQTVTESGGIALEAKKRGEAAVASDIAKLFPTSTLPHDRLVGMVQQGVEFKTGKGHKDVVRDVAETVEDLRRIHQFARNPNSGRTRKMKGIGMAITRKAVLRQYIRQELAKVGKLNAGWIAAATELRTASRNVPAWIKRHGTRPGGVNVNARGARVGIRIFNSQVWFPGDMERRVRLAVERRERGLQKATEAMLQRRARIAELRQRS